jgi:hypothetical protein
MSNLTTRTPNTIKSFTVKGIYDTIRSVTEAHVAVAHFDSGTEFEFGDNKAYRYPLGYLEEVVNIVSTDNGRVHTYEVALNILDLVQEGATRQERQNIQDNCYQIFLDIYEYLRARVFGEKRVFGFNVSVAPEYGNDRLMRVRADFRIQVDSPFTPPTPPQDLLQLFPSLL